MLMQYFYCCLLSLLGSTPLVQHYVRSNGARRACCLAHLGALHKAARQQHLNNPPHRAAHPATSHTCVPGSMAQSCPTLVL